MKWNYNREAKKIIQNNNYIVLSTTFGNKPWINMAFYAIDRKFNIYFVSTKFSKHTHNIMKNQNVAVAIFDSHQKPGTGVGLQIKGKAKMIRSKAELSRGLRIYFEKRYKTTGEREIHRGHNHVDAYFLKKIEYRLFRITPIEIYINNKDSDTDRRLKVRLR